jgi:hypothetical protein
MSPTELSRDDLLLTDYRTDKNYEVVSSTTRCSFTPSTHRQLITQVSTKDEPSTSSLEHDLNCNYIGLYDANSKLIFEGSFDNGNGKQLAINDGEHINYRHPNDTSYTHSSTNEYYIVSTTTYNINSSSTINYYTNSIVNSDTDKIIFDGTYTRRERRTLISISDIYDDTSGSITPCTSSSLVVPSNCHRKDEDIGTIISARTNTNYNGTRHELSSDDGEGITTSIDCNCTTISITVGSNILHRQIDYIHPSYHTHNKSVRCTVMHRLLSIVNNNVYNTLIGCDWAQGAIVRVVGKHSTSIPVCNDGTLHNPELIFGMDNMTVNMHSDGNINNHAYQDGEHRMSTRDTRFDSMLDNTTHNILNLENDDMYKHCKVKDHVTNTRECNTGRFMFECKNIGIGNGVYKCITNTQYNSLAIRTSSWIVLIMRYMHTTLHQLKSNERKIECSRLDGRGVTNVEHLGNIWGTHPISVNRKGIYDLV